MLSHTTYLENYLARSWKEDDYTVLNHSYLCKVEVSCCLALAQDIVCPDCFPWNHVIFSHILFLAHNYTFSAMHKVLGKTLRLLICSAFNVFKVNRYHVLTDVRWIVQNGLSRELTKCPESLRNEGQRHQDHAWFLSANFCVSFHPLIETLSLFPHGKFCPLAGPSRKDPPLLLPLSRVTGPASGGI